TRLGPYEVTALLGSGGMAEVYRARDVRLGREVAIKILPEELSSDEESLSRFTREAQTASALNHPHLVTIYDIGEVDVGAQRLHYIAMELIRGETLRHHFAHASREVLLRYIAGVADGLAKAHDAGVVHRDLKPENVMVSDDDFAKVVDFGLAPADSQRAEAGDRLDRGAAVSQPQRERGDAFSQRRNSRRHRARPRARRRLARHRQLVGVALPRDDGSAAGRARAASRG